MFNVFSYHLSFNAMMLVAVIVFVVGLLGLTARASNLMMVLLFGELMFVGILLAFMVFSRYLGDSSGQLYSMLILGAIAVESAVGMVLVLTTFQVKGSIDFSTLKCLRG